MKTNWTARVNEWVEQNQGFMIGLLQEMVRFKSINPNFMDTPSKSESAQLQNFIEEQLVSWGLTVDKWDVYENQPNVVATVEGKKEKTSFILNGHVDVVPVGSVSEWNFDPWAGKIHNGKLYGRGSCDMKAGVVSNMMAAKFMLDMGIELSSDLQLHIVIDEESGGAGTRSVLERGYVGNGVIVTEPTNEKINPVEGGLQWARVIVKGASAHTGWRYSHIYPGYEQTGVNVIEKSLKIMQAVLALEKDWGLSKSHPLLPPGITTINPGIMLAGSGEKDGRPETVTNPAIVPDYCAMEFDIKYLPTETTEDIKKEFEAAVHSVSATDRWLQQHPPQIEWGVRGVDFPPVNTPVDHPLVFALATSQRRLGGSPTYEGFVAVCDAAFYAGKGIPAVIYGPYGANLHGPDEYVEIESIYEVTKALILTVLEWNGILQNDIVVCEQEAQ